jgi:hypothetical protein
MTRTCAPYSKCCPKCTRAFSPRWIARGNVPTSSCCSSAAASER